jgi:hypothetical protein
MKKAAMDGTYSMHEMKNSYILVGRPERKGIMVLDVGGI